MLYLFCLKYGAIFLSNPPPPFFFLLTIARPFFALFDQLPNVVAKKKRGETVLRNSLQSTLLCIAGEQLIAYQRWRDLKPREKLYRSMKSSWKVGGENIHD